MKSQACYQLRHEWLIMYTESLYRQKVKKVLYKLFYCIHIQYIQIHVNVLYKIC